MIGFLDANKEKLKLSDSSIKAISNKVGQMLGGHSGGAIAESATENNLLEHWQYEIYIKELEKCTTDQEKEAVKAKWALVSIGQDGNKNIEYDGAVLYDINGIAHYFTNSKKSIKISEMPTISPTDLIKYSGVTLTFTAGFVVFYSGGNWIKVASGAPIVIRAKDAIEVVNVNMQTLTQEIAKYSFTGHAALRANERGYSLEAVNNIIQNYSHRISQGANQEAFAKLVNGRYHVVIVDKFTKNIITVVGGQGSSNTLKTLNDVKKMLENY